MTNNEDTESAWWHVRSSHGVPGVVRVPNDASAHGAEQFCEDGTMENPPLTAGETETRSVSIGRARLYSRLGLDHSSERPSPL